MSVRRLIASLGLVLLTASCAETTAPGGAVAPAPHFMTWGAAAPAQFTAVGAASQGMVQVTGGEANLNGLALTTYQASFWAKRGQSRTLQINYSGNGGTSPFMKLTITDPTYVPGRGNLAAGDSVLVTATIDPNNVAVDLQPTGTVFGTTAQLEFWYGGANGDLNGDAVVNSADAAIEAQLLGMWYQEGAGTPWIPIPATKSLSTKSFTTPLQHFSGYAVSW